MTRAETIGWIVATWLVLLNLAMPAVVMAEEPTPETRVHFNIPRQPADLALTQFAEQANLTLLFPTDGVQERTANELVGEYTLDEAIDILLAGTGLAPTFKNRLVLDIAIDDESTVMGEAMDIKKKAGLVGILAGVFAGNVNAEDSSQEPEREKLPTIEEIVVTGTNIRGIAPESSPVKSFSREDIQISGAATVQDFIQLLPQNFSGGPSPRFPQGLPEDISSQTNTAAQGSLGSSANLRGLGAGGTLILLNGHRLAPSSGVGSFVDISMIPASAVERVEVLTDGASSIYGADAVAGVINFILRDDFEGAETSFQYGTVTEGHLDEYRVSVTGGATWDKGDALVVYEFYDTGNLSAGDRDFSQGAPLPYDLLPSETRHSVLGSVSQELGTNVQLSGDFIFSTRESSQERTNSVAQFFRGAPISTNVGAAAGAVWDISDTWAVDFSGSYNGLHIESTVTGDFTVMREIDSTLWTGDAKASGTLFQLPGGDLKLAIGGHYRSERFENVDLISEVTEFAADRDIFALFAEALIPVIGPNNTLPGIKRLELNVSGRFADYSDFGSTANPKVGVLWSPFDGIRLRGSYSTSFNPPPLGRVGANDFLASVATTSLINSIFGLTAADPSIADVVVITPSGTSKQLDAENSRAFTAGFDLNQEWGNHQFAFTANYFDIKFENRLGTTPIPGNRIFFDAPNIAFNSPDAFPPGTVIFSPSTGEINAIINGLDSPPTILPPGLDPLDAEIINSVQVVRNLAGTFVTGFDFAFAYSLETNNETASLGLDATLLEDFKQQATAETPIVNNVDTFLKPVDFKLRGRLGYSNNNGFSANAFVNYTDDYQTDSTADAIRIDSWTTIDASIAYDTLETFESPLLRNMVFRVAVSNLFDKAPPSTPGNEDFEIFFYDPTNASPLGRFVSFTLTKQF